MTTETAVLFEFRCTQCFYNQYVTTDHELKQVQCTNCHQMTDVPQATPDRIARAEKAKPVQVKAPPVHDGNPYSSQSWSDADFEREAQKQFGSDPTRVENLANISSSRLKRFTGHLIDGMLLGLTYAVGMIAFVVLVNMKIIPQDVFGAQGNAHLIEQIAALVSIYAFPLGLAIIQWNMIAVEGKSIGKKILGMKIVRADGKNPGFIQGVVLRNWLRILLGLIPFFGLADALSIFGDSKRCIHDFLAGTYVVDHR